MSGLSVGWVLAAVGGVGAAGALATGLVLTWPSGDRDVAASATATLTPSVSTFAGSGPVDIPGGGLADGPVTAARFNDPAGLAVDRSDNVYVADFGNNVIRRISPAGQVVVFAGSGIPGFRDGPAAEAQFNGPGTLALDPEGNVYVTDGVNHRVRKIDLAGMVSTVAGGGTSGLGRGSYVDGPAAEARFQLPKGIAVDPAGNVFVADTDNLRIRVIRPSGIVETYAGTGDLGAKDGPRLQATFGFMASIALDKQGNLWIADQSNRLIRRISPSGDVQTVVKTGLGYAAVVLPFDDGSFAVSDTSNHVIRLYRSDGAPGQVFGSGRQGYRDGAASLAEFSNPGGLVAVGADLLVADGGNHRIRRLTR